MCEWISIIDVKMFIAVVVVVVNVLLLFVDRFQVRVHCMSLFWENIARKGTSSNDSGRRIIAWMMLDDD